MHSRNMVRLAAVAVLAWLVLAAPAMAQRVALVLGNAGYQAAERLSNPSADARGVAAALRRLGFTTDLVLDANRDGMEAALRRFGRAAEGAEIALFFYAGHGLQLGGENWLVPVDARLSDARDAEFELVGLNSALRQMEQARTRVVILDACRNNPLAARMRGLSGTRSLGRGLAPVEAQEVGTLIAFSTSPGAVAEDGSGRNSPFTAALLRHIERPGLDLQLILRQVRAEVRQATRGRQTPWENSSLLQEVVLRPGDAPVASRPAPPPDPDPEPTRVPPAPPGRRTPAPPDQLAAAAVPARPVLPGGTVAFRCPPRGLRASFDRLGALDSLGADPADPLVCLRGPAGAPTRWLFNLFAMPGYDDATLRAGLAELWPATVGRSTSFLYMEQSGARTWQFHDSWRVLRAEPLAVASQSRPTLVIERRHEGSLGNTFLGIERYWWDVETGVWLKREVEMIRGLSTAAPFQAIALSGP